MSASFDRARWAAASGMLLGALLIGSSPALAETGNVTLTATNNAKLTMTIGAPTAGFGTALDPSGTGTGGRRKQWLGRELESGVRRSALWHHVADHLLRGQRRDGLHHHACHLADQCAQRHQYVQLQLLPAGRLE